ncbi:MAG: alanine racemase [Persephonella sp.]|nr:MAG: alanine racemase [Persephonella sp.]
MLFRSWAEIDTKTFKKNLKNIYQFIKKDIFAVVKADAYGHCARELSKILEEKNYVKKLCVATALEGKEIREAGVKKDILVLGGILPSEIEIFNSFHLTPVISDFSQLELVKKLKVKKIHINFDTGMHRLGFYKSDIESIVSFVKRENILIEGIMSHFPSADIDTEFTNHQINQLKKILFSLKNFGILPEFIHIQNSAGLMYNCDVCNAVRVGLALYGEKPVENFPVEIENIMSVKAKVISKKKLKKGDKVSYCGTFEADRDMYIATVSFGYADGLPRKLSNKGKVIINGKFARILGNITMDMIMVDIDNFESEVKEEDEVIIIGKSRDKEIRFSDIADLSGTIPYEIMCGISKRVKRFFV